MGEKIPRRMQRFHRENNSEEIYSPNYETSPTETEEIGENVFGQMQKGGKERTMELAVNEVKRFRTKHKRYPAENEFNQISENIFAQLKSETEKNRRIKRVEDEKKRLIEKLGKQIGKNKRTTKNDKNPVQAKRRNFPNKEIVPEINENEISIKDMFSEEKLDSKPETIEKIETQDNDEFSLGNLESFDDSEKKICPTCKRKTNEIIFCPECGTGFCEQCSSSVGITEGEKKFKCPQCGKEITKTN